MDVHVAYSISWSWQWIQSMLHTCTCRRHGQDCSFSLNYFNTTDNNQPWKLTPALGSQPESILAFQESCLTSLSTRHISQNGKFSLQEKFHRSPSTTKIKPMKCIVFSSMYKWSKFIWLSRHSEANKARLKFNRKNSLPPKIFQSTVTKWWHWSSIYIYVYTLQYTSQPY